MPLAVIAMLVISLVESIIILPCHLAHSRPAKNPRGISVFFRRVNQFADRKLTFAIERVYRPTIHWCLENPATVLSISASILIVTFACIRAGIAPFILFPKIDSNQIFAKVVYPDGTPSRITEQASLRLEKAIDEVDRQLSTDGQDLVVFKHLAVGSISSPGALGPDTRTTRGHVGNVSVELIETSQREVTSQTILAAWRKAAGEFPGADSVTFGTPDFGPGGRPIEFKLLAPAGSMKDLEEAVDQTKVQLGQYRGVFDISDDSRPGKWEFQLQIDDKAKAMGVSLADLAETVRASYYGEEVMRLQRGRHEVKLMVRYPRDNAGHWQTLVICKFAPEMVPNDPSRNSLG